MRSEKRCERAFTCGGMETDSDAISDWMKRMRGSVQIFRRPLSGESKREKRGASPFLPQSGGGNYFFAGAITSLAALATRNLTTVFALILMAAPV